MKDYQFTLLIILSLAVGGRSYPSCSIVEFPDYSFDLSNLKNVTISIKNDGQYAQYYPCIPDSCSEGSSQQSFLLKGAASNCESYSRKWLLNQSIPQSCLTTATLTPASPSWALG